MRIKKNFGFTLVELMVVIVIIGILASLAIPRFTEASDKAKMAEAPRVIAVYETTFLSYVAETGSLPEQVEDLIFELVPSRWFEYVPSSTDISAFALAPIGKLAGGASLTSTYEADGRCFYHDSSDPASALKLVPNFFGNGCVTGGF